MANSTENMEIYNNNIYGTTNLTTLAMTNSFASTVQREAYGAGNKDSVPGPGSYDVQIQDKLKVLNYQLSTRYHLKPFGSGSVRFGYQQP